MSSPSVSGTDGDHHRINAGAINAAVDDVVIRILAIVAGGRHNHDASFGRALCRLAERIGLIAFWRQGAEAEIHDADVVGFLIGNAPIDTGDHIRCVAAPIRTEHTDVDDTRSRSNPGELSGIVIEVSPGASSERGDVRAVTISVTSAAIARHKTDAPHTATR